MADLVKIEDIPILGTGTYLLSTGVATFTEEHLRDAVKAAEEDPTLRRPRLKIGHTDDGWQAGEPSFGSFVNLRLSDNGQEILADLETFDWLADVIPVMWPNRSIEGYFDIYNESSGRTYSLVIPAVSLLGIEFPGVGSLDDLRDVLEAKEVSVVAKKGGQGFTVRASIDVDKITKTYYSEFATGERYWWWIRSVRLDPNEIIVEDYDSGALYRVPFDVDEQAVTFGDPVEVYEQFVDAPQTEDAEQDKEAAKASVLATWRTPPRDRMKATTEVNMTPEELREQLGLSADATDDEVKAKIAELKAASEEPDEEQDDDDDTNDDTGDDDDEKDGQKDEKQKETVPASRKLPNGAVLVDAEALAKLQAGADAGLALKAEGDKKRRQGKVDAAIQDGRVVPHARASLLKQMEQDEKATSAYLDSLTPGIVPVNERGSNPVNDADVSAANAGGAYPDEWLTPQERARKERVIARRAAAQGVS